MGTERAGRYAVAVAAIMLLGVAWAQPPGAPNPAPNMDGRILNVAQIANNSEIDQGNLARHRVKDPRVNYFASMMVAHHTDLGQRGEALGVQQRIPLVASNASEMFQVQSTERLLRLRDAGDDAIDRHYMDAEVEGHERFLRMLDQELMPSARDPVLQVFLRDVRYTVAEDLISAKVLQKDLLR